MCTKNDRRNLTQINNSFAPSALPWTYTAQKRTPPSTDNPIATNVIPCLQSSFTNRNGFDSTSVVFVNSDKDEVSDPERRNGFNNERSGANVVRNEREIINVDIEQRAVETSSGKETPSDTVLIPKRKGMPARSTNKNGQSGAKKKRKEL